jgi:tetratricopeptide (TPR) repeat protein
MASAADLNGPSGSSPAVAGPQARSIDEAARNIENTPLFMKSLPPAGEMDDRLAMQMEALQSLLYEGDAEGELQVSAPSSAYKIKSLTSHISDTEQAQNFKEQGNDQFKAKKYKEAIAYYTQGLGNLDPELREETKRTLWSNRAMCHLELGTYSTLNMYAYANN